MYTSVVETKILVIALNRGYGDALLFAPALKALEEKYSNRLSVLVDPRFIDFIHDNLGISTDNFLTYDNDFLKTLAEIKAQKFDLVIDFTLASKEGALLTFFSGARIRIGVVGSWRRWPFYNVRVKPMLSDHYVDVCLKLVETVNVSSQNTNKLRPREKPLNPNLEVFFAAEDEQLVHSFLKREGIHDDDLLISFHPSARDNIDLVDKRWPAERFAMLGDLLSTKYGAKVLLVGDKNEIQLGEKISKMMRYKSINAIGKTAISQLIALIDKSSLFIGNNSAPLHIAVARGIPTISFSGGIDLMRWRPYGDSQLHKIILRDENCRPELCWSCRDKGSDCLGVISVEKVLQNVEDTLSNLRKTNIGLLR